MCADRWMDSVGGGTKKQEDQGKEWKERRRGEERRREVLFRLSKKEQTLPNIKQYYVECLNREAKYEVYHCIFY